MSNPAFLKPLKVNAALAEIVGTEPLPRPQIIKKMWDYIKANNLQDPKNKRMIIADAKLKPVFGGLDQVNMFEMAKCISKCLEK
jgi:chromatin remodeling complex protein RSC6